MISSKIFWGLLVFSLFIVAVFYAGMRKNMRMAREMATLLEDVFKPVDKTYTWLGGVMGFVADYKVKGFKKIYANFRLIPRHSLLWLPFALIAGRKDTLQLLFYLKGMVNQEFHVVRKGVIKPKIYNIDKLKSKSENGFILHYQFTEDFKEEVLPIANMLFPYLFHLAITPEKNIFYIECKGHLLDDKFKQSLSEAVRMIKEFQDKRA